MRTHAPSWVRYRKAAATGNAVAQAAAGNMYLRGEGVDKNPTAAIDMYEKAAAQDNVRALNGQC